MKEIALGFVDVERTAGLVQKWACGGCGHFVSGGAESLVFMQNPANTEEQQPQTEIIPVLVHADCGQGIRHASTWEEWWQRLESDPDAKLPAARAAVKAAVGYWAEVDMDADPPEPVEFGPEGPNLD